MHHRRLVVGTAAVLLPLALAAWSPATVDAVAGWSLSVDPQALRVGRETEVTFRLTDTAAGYDIGCVKIKPPGGSEVELDEAKVTHQSPGIEWRANLTGDDENNVRARAKTDSDRLQPDQWVDIHVNVRPMNAGSETWSAEVYEAVDCRLGGQILSKISIEFTFDWGSRSPTPTMMPTATPTPTRAPTPPPTATPRPTVAPTATPSPKPLASARPTEPATPRPTNTPRSTVRPTPTDGGPVVPVITPSPAPHPSPSDQPAASARPQSDSFITDRWDFAYEMPTSLYEPGGEAPAGLDEGIEAVARLGTPVSWFVPALVTGVPGLLIVIIILAQVLLGVSWLPNVGRLLGPEPKLPDEDTHVWWAAGRPIEYGPAAQGEGWPSRIMGRFRQR